MSKYLIAFFLLMAAASVTSCVEQQPAETEKPAWALAIHGGAGTILKQQMTPEKEQQYLGTLREALAAGAEVLDGGGNSPDAVVAAIMVMEDSPLFNAGKGAVFTAEGHHEMDAAIMDGRDLSAGAAAGLSHVKNPILAARAIMEHTDHVMLTGAGAERIAAREGLVMVDSSYFFTTGRYDSFLRARDKAEVHGTVGAVALDSQGNLAAGTSTGGMTYKLKGRVGDSPVIGAGTYADNRSCAVSATGHGEYFIRYVVAHEIAALMKYRGLSLEDAASEVINDELKAAGGDGGVIAVDREGNVAMPFNTAGMYRGYINSNGKTAVLIYGEE